MNYPDKLGCYRVGDLKFYSKLEAIEYMQKTGIHLHWDFNESVFSSYDWTVEPKENILELYRQRAEQLRNQYDYIVLMYSGGADSHTVLESFLDNDIRLDEAVSWTNYQATNDPTNYLNSELFRVSIPTIKEKYPNLKHRVIDFTDLTLDFFNEKNCKDWIYEVNNFFSPNNAMRESFALKIGEWADLIEQGKKLCVLWGKDKPRILHIDGKFVFRLLDLIDDAATVKSMSGKQPYTDEFFYWTPDKPEILIKQAHLIKNYLSVTDPSQLPYVSLEKSDLASVVVDGKRWGLNNHGVHSIIYPNWNVNTWSFGKPTSIIVSLRDTWFYNISGPVEAKTNFTTGLDKVIKMLPDYWKNDVLDFSKGTKACWSKDYFLEKT